VPLARICQGAGGNSVPTGNSGLAKCASRLRAAEDFFDPLTDGKARPIAGVPRDSPINRRAFCFLIDMRRHFALAQGGYEIPYLIGLVLAYRGIRLIHAAHDHGFSHFPPHRAGGVRYHPPLRFSVSACRHKALLGLTIDLIRRLLRIGAEWGGEVMDVKQRGLKTAPKLAFGEGGWFLGCGRIPTRRVAES
jgi:hypothetical protein